ncbi:putative transcriptional regulator [Pseudomonas aeruginosa]|nr:putative transcriptional regulator [Pseudomonas aeruginosa]
MAIRGSSPELGGHLAVNYQSPSSGRTFDFEFSVDGRLRTLPMRSRVSVNNADAYVAACRAGLGLIQAPHYHVAAGLADGSLRQVLGEWLPPSLPLHAVYPLAAPVVAAGEGVRRLGWWNCSVARRPARRNETQAFRAKIFLDFAERNLVRIGSLGLSSRDVRPSSGCPLPPGRIHSNKNKDR